MDGTGWDEWDGLELRKQSTVFASQIGTEGKDIAEQSKAKVNGIQRAGTCTIRIQCSHRAEVSWGLMHTLTTILIEGDGVARPGCVKDLEKGGVAALGVVVPFFIPYSHPYPT